MGVPGFVSWLREHSKDIMIINKLPKNVKIFYIDGNCLIHPKCFEVLSYKNRIGNLEDVMFKRICKYIDYLLDYVKPEECYFAIDGVAPVAKINQQRKRRFKSIDDAQMKDELKIKHKIELDTKWSNIVITPGTTFMENLHQHLLKYFKNKGIKYNYSSYHIAGEGEHKILTDIKERLNKQNKQDRQDNQDDQDIYVIYGLDADLFFLAMASQKNNIYLLREELHFTNGKVIKHEINDIIEDVSEELKYVSIDITKKCYNEIIKNVITKKIGIDKFNKKYDYWNDFIFICYFLGNDFLPHFPSIDIHKTGLDMIIDCYTDILIETGYQLIIVKDDVSINNIFLLRLLEYLGNCEDNYFREILPKYNYNKSKRKCFFTDEYSKELWTIENMCFKVDDPIKLGYGDKKEWKFRYYEHYFGISENQQEYIDKMSYSYLEGLIWVTKYYYNECPSWNWQYPYTHAPFISDIYEYFRKSNLDVNKITFTKSRPLDPYIQLLAVLPPSCVNMIPKKYAELVTDYKSPIYDMFPLKVEIDMINKDMYWMCIPLLPYLDIDRILKAVENINKK